MAVVFNVPRDSFTLYREMVSTYTGV